ncbi:unnamed protein product [Bursaphelenchus okinawaensis]|uniref:glutathione transferase n=1 Tax=Bursaphelenchus okinawaensis TaxID=465554 RepID=A0A811K308_9BILA|nr:unnamed protein product [Bursaphelenchus okinawaensis]CAG9090623.1 unnamed protein product [Bursaphelenchus okinawaensis]
MNLPIVSLLLLLYCTSVYPVIDSNPQISKSDIHKFKANILPIPSNPPQAHPHYYKRNGNQILVPMVPLSVMTLGNDHKPLRHKARSLEELSEVNTEEEESKEDFDIDSDIGTERIYPKVTSSTTHPSTTTPHPTTTSPVDKPIYKLIYFDARGICESIRLMFIYSNIPFIDKRITLNEWMRLKETTEFGKLPILEVNSKKLSQCLAISRYLAHKFGMAGSDEWEVAKLDEVSEFHREVVHDISPYFYVVSGYRKGNADQMRRDVFLPAIEKHLPNYVKLLKKSKSGFFGKKVSWIDFTISEFLFTLKTYESRILRKFPQLVRFLDRVYHLPEIRNYLKERAKTPL